MQEDTLVNKLKNIICGEHVTNVCELTVSKLVATMQEACTRCMSDRSKLILNPMCKGRFYLSLLVEAGIPKTELPADCYKVRLDEIQKILAGKPNPLPVKDAVIKLSDFLRTFSTVFKLGTLEKQMSDLDPEKIVSTLSKIVKEREDISFSGGNTKAYLLIRVKKEDLVINLLDLARQIAYINLDERHLDIDFMDGLSSVLLQACNLQGRGHLTPTGNFYLEIELPSNIDAKILGDIFKGLDYTTIVDGKRILRVKIVELGRPVVSYGELIKIFKSLAGVRR